MPRAILLTAFAWLILGLAPASKPRPSYPPPGDCMDDRGVDRCKPEQQRRVREMFGVKPIEAHRDSGDQVRRAFYVDGYGHDVVAIAFVRPKGGDPSLWIHFPREPEGKPAEPLRAPVPLEVWENVVERSVHFDRQLVPLPDEVGTASSEEITLCLHGWVYTIEATDPARGEHQPATLRRRTEDACDNGLTETYAQELERAAVPLLAPCARLDPRQHRNGATLLSACRLLSGDRLAAAEVLNRSHPFFRDADDAAELARLFEYDATVDWNGERNEGRNSAARFWAAKVQGSGGSRFYYDGVDGKGGGEVLVKGRLFRPVEVPDGAPSLDEVARVEQLWSEREGAFAVRSVTVGPFERRPRP